MATAIGMNFVIVGAGYFYIGKPLVGTLVFVILALTAGVPLGLVISEPNARDAGSVLACTLGWLIVWHVLMIVDLSVRHRKAVKANERACPQCAETIKLAAKVCRHCGADVT